ncbi:PhzF family phenazine biosynthesis protein [Planctomonas sp. JC2975]|uniref:PhzF family phenazine biosynthesis protein n=1 Tax=Planctomonas sp. JC2975 TaxID=2729626 RepID=UPI001473E91E|nr:PhzF family phenazine biosynthesis isomerase [Planctomonas sp. JC2975]NNC13737.1 PhzF family phenazine biosynthesis protein [Planctomonas sp. JC2975]
MSKLGGQLHDASERAFFICDVFSHRPLGGNSVTVVLSDVPMNEATMGAVTRELRQFETIFLTPTRCITTYDARVFDMNGELAFAGHPVLGAAAVLHELHGTARTHDWVLRLRERVVPVGTAREEGHKTVHARMDQGAPVFGAVASEAQASRAALAFGLNGGDLASGLPVEVVSTGLRYLIVPVTSGVGRAHVVHPTLQQLLDELDAQFAYLLNVAERTGRHWENDGSVEDIATGSAAGAAAAYLLRHGLVRPGERVTLRQGDSLGRPSTMNVELEGTPGEIRNVELAGPVTIVGRGILNLDPNPAIAAAGPSETRPPRTQHALVSGTATSGTCSPSSPAASTSASTRSR